MSNGQVIPQRDVSDASVHLDAIRGLAALVVFLGHGRSLFLSSGVGAALVGAGGGPDNGISQELTRNAIGHEAVIIFFVLSGYLVGGSVLRALKRNRFSWSSYLFQRGTRLWVPLIPAVLLGWTLDYCGIHLLQNAHDIYSAPVEQATLPPGMGERMGLSTILGNIVLLPGDMVKMVGSNASLWSLAYEAWYYVFFPLLMIALFTAKALPLRLAAALGLIAAMLFCGQDIVLWFPVWLLGAVVAALPLGLPSGARRPVTAVLGLLLIAVLVLALKIPMLPLASDMAIGAAFSMFLWAVLHARGSTAPSWYRRPAMGLSKMSYTLYLAHLPVLVLICACLMPVWKPWPVTPHSLAMLSGVYAFAFLVCWLLYIAFERNTDAIRLWLLRSRASTARARA